jgi:hypothetical protein
LEEAQSSSSYGQAGVSSIDFDRYNIDIDIDIDNDLICWNDIAMCHVTNT